MNKELFKASGIRALRSFLQALIAQIPAGFVITPAMIQYFKVGYIYITLAIIANAALYAFVAFCTGIIGGLPEVQLEETLYSLDNEADEEYMNFVDEIDETIDEEGDA